MIERKREAEGPERKQKSRIFQRSSDSAYGRRVRIWQARRASPNLTRPPSAGAGSRIYTSTTDIHNPPNFPPSPLFISYRPLYIHFILVSYHLSQCRTVLMSIRRRGSSTRILRTAAPSSPSPVRISLSSRATPGRARATVSRHVMRPKSSGCTCTPSRYADSCAPTHISLSRTLRRTDRAVLAVNGFAADGNMFVKKVKQRLEVRRRIAPESRSLAHSNFPVVPPCTRKGHASARHCTVNTNYVVCTTILPILCIQHLGWY